MRFTQLVMLLVLLLCSANNIFAQATPQIKVEVLTDNIVKINAHNTEYSANMIAMKGKDGVLLIDTGFAVTADTLKTYLKTFSDKKVKYIINTHIHTDHSGGNIGFDDDVTIIAHEALRRGLESGRYIVEEFPANAKPDITLTDSLTLHFNDEIIKMYALPGSHNNDDIIVHLVKAKLVVMGDLGYGMKFPSWDGETGKLNRYADVMAKSIELLPEDVKVITGHGKVRTIADMQEFHRMLKETTDYVTAGIESGKTLEDIQKDHKFEEFEKFGNRKSYTVSTWLGFLYDDINTPVKKITVVEPLYHAYHKGGVEAVKKTFLDLKKNHQDKYQFDPFWNIYMPDYLMLKGKYEESIELYKFILEMDPEYIYRYTMLDYMANTYAEMGNTKKAIEVYKESLKLYPEGSYAQTQLKKLENKNETK